MVGGRLYGSGGPKPHHVEKICEAAKAGAPAEICAYYAGIHPGTLSWWLKIGEETDEDDEVNKHYRDFYHQYMLSIAEQTVDLLQFIERAGKRDPRSWGALAWKLEKRFPHYFAPINRNVNMDGKGAGLGTTIEDESLPVDLDALGKEELLVLDRLLKVAKGNGTIDGDSKQLPELPTPTR